MSLIKCSECGAEISEKATICPKCGVTLTPKSLMIKCLECGAEIPSKSKKCPKCGNPQDLKGGEVIKTEKNGTTQRSKQRSLPIILVIIIIFLVLAISYLLFSQFSGPKYDAQKDYNTAVVMMHEDPEGAKELFEMVIVNATEKQGDLKEIARKKIDDCNELIERALSNLNDYDQAVAMMNEDPQAAKILFEKVAINAIESQTVLRELALKKIDECNKLIGEDESLEVEILQDEEESEPEFETEKGAEQKKEQKQESKPEPKEYVKPVKEFQNEKYRQCKTNLRKLGKAIRKYAKDHDGHYPKYLNKLVSGGYIDKIRKCPKKNRSYVYKVFKDGSNFTLCCPNPDNHFYEQGKRCGRICFNGKQGMKVLDENGNKIN